eukprot:scaffold222241_cov27-Tisochrysis_lutea.AAC.1
MPGHSLCPWSQGKAAHLQGHAQLMPDHRVQLLQRRPQKGQPWVQPRMNRHSLLQAEGGCADVIPICAAQAMAI